MKILAFIFITVLFFSSCASYHPNPSLKKEQMQLFALSNIQSIDIKLYQDTINLYFDAPASSGCGTTTCIKNKKVTKVYEDKLMQILQKSLYIYAPDMDAFYIETVERTDRCYDSYMTGVTNNTNPHSVSVKDKSCWEKDEIIKELHTYRPKYKIASTPYELGFKVKYKPISTDYHSYRGNYNSKRFTFVHKVLVEIADYRPLIKRYKEAIQKYDATLLNKLTDKVDMNHFINTDLEQALMKTNSLKKAENIMQIAKLGSIKMTKHKLIAKINTLRFENKYKYMSTQANYIELNKYLANKKRFVGVDQEKLKKLKKRKAQQYIVYLRGFKSFEDYLKAYSITSAKQDLKNAYKLASTRREKAIIEEKIVERVGFSNLFDVQIKKTADKIKTFQGSSFISSNAGSYQTLHYDITIKPKKSSSIKLKYNNYKLTLEFILHPITDNKKLKDRLKNTVVEKMLVLTKENNYEAHTKFSSDIVVVATIKGVMNINGRYTYDMVHYQVKRVDFNYKVKKFGREK